jgi:protein-tyrosine-phosphatase
VKAEPPVVLFVCTGNICRSPMAVAIAAAAAFDCRIDVRAVSAGTAALEGHPAHATARDAMEEFGLTLDSHVARQITRELVGSATLVVAVTARHRDDLRRFFPRHTAKIVSFDDVTGLGDLDDPFGGGPPEFRRTAELLRRGMPDVLTAVVRAAGR